MKPRPGSLIRVLAVTGVLVAVTALHSQTKNAPSAPAHLQQATGPVLDMTPVRPELEGFSSARLERLHALMQEAVDKKQVSGVVTILARHGKIVDYRAYGQRDMASGAPMTKDTIFRDYSMTKPVTGVAMMTLYEEGKWLPSDPISKFIPEFAHLKVFNGVDANGKMILVDPDHAPTMRELMTHTAGFTYGVFGDTPVDKMYRDADFHSSKNLQEVIDKLAAIPLLYQPGTKWVYSMSMDIEGYIVQKLSGEPFDDYMRDQIYKPLGMKDAGFYVPEEKKGRLASLYEYDQQGNVKADSTNGRGYGGFLTPAGMAVGRRRDGFHRGGLLPLRADAGRRWSAERDAHPGAVLSAPDDIEPLAGEAADGRVQHWLANDAAGLRVRIQLRGGVRPTGSEFAGRQGHVLLGWRGGNVVLGRPD